LGYLTGEEDDIMKNAHVESLQLLATPFREDTQQPFAFGPGSTWAGITAEIRERIPIMLHHRLTPPPRETYSLNRKLSGAFLLASRLRATVDSKKLWDNVIGNYKFSTSV
jgi:aarF domain-containing kinase